MTHHKLFDLNAFTIDGDAGVLISQQVTGSSQLDRLLLRHHRAAIRPPQHSPHRPAPEFLYWHRHEVFKGRPRSD